MGGPEDFGVRTGRLIRLQDLPLPRSRRLLGAVAATNLGQKPKLGGVRVLLPFSIVLSVFYFVRFDLFEVFARSSLLFYFAKTTKRFPFSFAFVKPLKTPKRFPFCL